MIKKIPFTYLWIISKSIGRNAKTVVDLGCGDGRLMHDIKGGEKWEIVGVELHEASLKEARESGVYKSVIKGDVLNLPNKVTKEKFDIVISSQVLEHLKKSVGKIAIKSWEQLAKKRVVITIPVGFIEYDPIEQKSESNPLQKHLSGWTPAEMRAMGYVVRGQGLRLIYGEKGLIRHFPKLFQLFSIVGLLFAPLVYFYPNLGLYMIAYKKV